MGYVEGQNIHYIFNGPVVKRSQLQAVAEILISQKPDMLFTSPTPSALAAKKATLGISLPVVFAPVNDPLAAKVVDSLQQPGGNITGVRLAPSDGVRLEWLQKIKPALKEVRVLRNPSR